MIQLDDFCSLLSHYIAIPRHCNGSIWCYGARGYKYKQRKKKRRKEDSAKAKDISLLISQHIWEFLEFS
jgi:hypothetical protein